MAEHRVPRFSCPPDARYSRYLTADLMLRTTDPRIASQMLDLGPYAPVSSMPPVRRDLSVAMDAVPDPELLGDRIYADPHRGTVWHWAAGGPPTDHPV